MSRPQADRTERAERADRSAPVPARVSAPLPALIVDETDDAGGHRIHVNPWAAGDEE